MKKIRSLLLLAAMMAAPAMVRAGTYWDVTTASATVRVPMFHTSYSDWEGTGTILKWKGAPLMYVDTTTVRMHIGSGFTVTDSSQSLSVGTDALKVHTTGIDEHAIGNHTLQRDIDGYENTAVGDSALTNLTHGNNNTAVGSSAGANVTTGTFNTYIGVSAAETASTGNLNTAVGASALQLETSGSNNTAIGDGALFNQVGVSNNTGLGYAAGYNTTNGTNNVYLGKFAGQGPSATQYNATGSGNIFIGSGSGAATTALNNAAAFGTNAIVSASNVLMLGNAVGDTYAYNVKAATFTASGDFEGSGAGLTNVPAASLTGTVPAANGGTGNTGGAWTTFTPAVTAWISGSIGTSTGAGRYQTIGKTTCASITVTFSGVVTAAGFFVGLPNSAQSTVSLPGWNDTAGTACMGISNVSLANALNGYTPGGAAFTPVAGQKIYFNGCYENQ